MRDRLYTLLAIHSISWERVKYQLANYSDIISSELRSTVIIPQLGSTIGAQSLCGSYAESLE